jgi:hypothetical protein
LVSAIGGILLGGIASKMELPDLPGKLNNLIYGTPLALIGVSQVIKNTALIKNTSSRWGSCSRLGNLNFNYKIVFLPPELQDYLVVHELCHLGQFNHSQSFWNLVKKTIPEYLRLRKNLRDIGSMQADI